VKFIFAVKGTLGSEKREDLKEASREGALALASTALAAITILRSL